MSRRQVTQRKKTIPAWVWVSIVGGLLFMGMTGLFAVNVVANVMNPYREELLPTPQEIESKVVGMNEAEVLKYLGRPTYTSRDKWSYYESARDAVAGGTTYVNLHFENGVVKSVGY